MDDLSEEFKAKKDSKVPKIIVEKIEQSSNMNLDLINDTTTNSARSTQFRSRPATGTKYHKFMTPLDYVKKNHKQHTADIINELAFSQESFFKN